jgi:hypothetical protein
MEGFKIPFTVEFFFYLILLALNMGSYILILILDLKKMENKLIKTLKVNQEK